MLITCMYQNYVENYVAVEDCFVLRINNYLCLFVRNLSLQAADVFKKYVNVCSLFSF